MAGPGGTLLLLLTLQLGRASHVRLQCMSTPALQNHGQSGIPGTGICTLGN